MLKEKLAYILGNLLICCFALFQANAQTHTNTDPFQQLLKRIVKGHVTRFETEIADSTTGVDYFELSSNNQKIKLRANNFNSLAVGLNYYLKYYCLTTVSWYANDPVELPRTLPDVPTVVRQSARVQKRFFLNYCTFGYTMPWWQWRDWERLIDWMALNGINMPLAITGQEAIWYRVWKKFGLSDIQIRSFFTGPAHLPWHRMSNLDKWQGPLPISYIENQLKLQKLILARERELNMTPVLPAFAGHVPQALLSKYPSANISALGEWGGFPDQYRSYFLDPFDSLFRKIQHEFITEQTKEFGTGHVYGADPFNEVKPPSWEPDYLAAVSKTIYSSLTNDDPAATWLMMAWIFYFERDHWTDERVKAFVQAVPTGKMMLLDYFCENTEVWKITDSFYGQPFLWCYLGNFGGNTMLAGNLSEVEHRMEQAIASNGKGPTGIGSTLEGFDVNHFMYEYVFEKAWSNNDVGYRDWIEKLAARRAGKKDIEISSAWKLLVDSVYTHSTGLGQATLTNARPSLHGNGNWTTNPEIRYSNRVLFDVWEKLVSSAVSNRRSFDYDIVNIGRQVLGNYFLQVRDSFSYAYATKNKKQLGLLGKRMLEVLDDMDKLLATHSSFLLGKWLSDAKSFALDDNESAYYEENARVIITTWGRKAQSLNDYASRNWAGLMKSYYTPRWKLFIADVIAATGSGKKFDEEAFHQKITAFEIGWTKQRKTFSSQPVGNTVRVATQILGKYRSFIKSK